MKIATRYRKVIVATCMVSILILVQLNRALEVVPTIVMCIGFIMIAFGAWYYPAEPNTKEDKL